MPKRKYEGENNRDDWSRITLRLPPQMHKDLLDQAGALSLNATIVQRLEASLRNDEEAKLAESLLQQATKEREEASKEVQELNTLHRELRSAIAETDKLLAIRNKSIQEVRDDLIGNIGELIRQSVSEAIRDTLRAELSASKQDDTGKRKKS